ncbi:lipopolysaccharide biosynthesis protein [Spirosoma utsteinense]|uniref:O-antigen/teichoic acid export membrane protein n=1 Tax=Spirosoma utsteinense TaxID=2585773 RepID=A0ABR6W9V8_9BACT|nr:oligosaccharide flippase family protein [Spirosoma utsteinense]MBC3787406.1 O-antigen/teichoic acid export membrane protein [Spirosoma utsteinense]MBC3793039.1 O-antigen/teichoic acid export membrane protein [Spirosoma utsteinense]
MLTTLQTKLLNKTADGRGRLTYLLSSKTSGRDRNIFKNVFLSFSYKGLSILLTLAIIPLSINYLDTERYGVWLTLSSVLTWINLMDIGLGNGLRNKLVKALSDGDQVEARKLTSTTYVLVALMMLVVISVFLIALPFIDLNAVFNIHTVEREELAWVMLVAFFAFCLLFILKPVTAVIMATQNAALDNMILLMGNLLSISCVAILVYGTDSHGSLLSLVLVFSLAPVVAYVLGSLYVYKRLYPFLMPSLAYFDRAQIRALGGTSIQFFIIQISATIVLTSNNIILSQFFGNEQVTRYNVIFRYFSVITIIQTIVLTPIWSAVTEAYQKGDFAWIKSALNKLMRNAALLSAITVIQIIAAPWVMEKWLGSKFIIDPAIVFAVATYTILITFSSSFSYVINGLGTIRLQTCTSVLTTLFSIPLSIYLAKEVGPTGVILANCLWLALWLPLRITQYRKIVRQTATGIWLR